MNAKYSRGIRWALWACTLSALLPGRLQSQVPPPPAPIAAAPEGPPPNVPMGGIPQGPPPQAAPYPPGYVQPPHSSGLLGRIQEHRHERFERRQQRRQHMSAKVKSLLHLGN